MTYQMLLDEINSFPLDVLNKEVIIRGMSNTYGVRYIQRNYNLYDEKNGCEAEYIDYPAIVLGPTDKFVISRY